MRGGQERDYMKGLEMPEAFLLLRDRFLCDAGPIAEPNCVTPGRTRQQHG